MPDILTWEPAFGSHPRIAAEKSGHFALCAIQYQGGDCQPDVASEPDSRAPIVSCATHTKPWNARTYR